MKPQSTAALMIVLLAGGALAETDCEVLGRTIPALDSSNCCSHPEVICDGSQEDSRIIKLNAVNITGSIPEDIEKLTELTKIKVGATFTGVIPENITLLPNLRILRFEFTDLEGQLPSTLGRLSSLVELTVYGNNINGSIPISICDLPKVEKVYLGYNMLTGVIPACIGDLADTLVALDVSDNYLTGELPKSLGLLTKLRFFFLNFSYSDYGKNAFTGELPHGLKEFVDLERMWLNVETLRGPIPDLTGLDKLQECSFVPGNYCRDWNTPVESTCDFSLIPACVPDCIALSKMFDGVYVESCCEQDGISCNADSRILKIDLTDAGINGQITNDIAGLVFLESFTLKNNSVNGTLPDELFKLPFIVKIDVSFNLLHGSIPAAIKNSQLVEQFDFSNNQFTGMVPDFSKNLKLVALNLSNNAGLTGELLVGNLATDVIIDNTGVVLADEHAGHEETHEADSSLMTSSSSYSLGSLSPIFMLLLWLVW